MSSLIIQNFLTKMKIGERFSMWTTHATVIKLDEDHIEVTYQPPKMYDNINAIMKAADAMGWTTAIGPWDLEEYKYAGKHPKCERCNTEFVTVEDLKTHMKTFGHGEMNELD